MSMSFLAPHPDLYVLIRAINFVPLLGSVRLLTFP